MIPLSISVLYRCQHHLLLLSSSLLSFLSYYLPIFTIISTNTLLLSPSLSLSYVCLNLATPVCLPLYQQSEWFPSLSLSVFSLLPALPYLNSPSLPCLPSFHSTLCPSTYTFSTLQSTTPSPLLSHLPSFLPPHLIPLLLLSSLSTLSIYVLSHSLTSAFSPLFPTPLHSCLLFPSLPFQSLPQPLPC